MTRSPGNDILIIGAGPAGLAMAGRLRQAGIGFRILEKSQNIADRWHHHYDRLHLHTVKRLSHLPHMGFPKSFPTYVPRRQLVEYFEQYARHFQIEPEFGVEVSSISKHADHWQVDTSQGPMLALHVIIATGVNNKPYLPRWQGREQFAGTVTHSIDYRNPEPYLNTSVLVIGMGNTGAEIALDLAEHHVSTWISVRGSINVVPRDLNGQPVQETGKLLEKLPFGLGQWIGAKVQDIYFGDLSKYGLQRSSVPPAVQLRETGKTPLIDIGTIKAIKEGRVKVIGEIGRFTHDGVTLKTGENVRVDHIVLATGYRSCLDGMVENMDQFLDPMGYPRGPVGDGKHTGLYFVGFDNYKLGGILGTIYTDSKTVIDTIAPARLVDE